MDNTILLFWFIATACAATFISSIVRHHWSTEGWLLVSLTILITLTFAWLRKSTFLIYVAGMMWAVLIVLPTLLALIANKRIVRQDYDSAYRLFRVVAVLHPFEGWREQPTIIRALGLANAGNLDAAIQILRQFENRSSPIAHTAMINLYRITSRWEDFLAWAKQLPERETNDSSFVPIIIRALAESGEVAAAIDLYDEHKSRLAKSIPAMNRDLARLVIFAFSGRRDLVERLFTGALGALPDRIKSFWIATAEMASGEIDSGREKLDAQLVTADAWMRTAIGRRLSKAIPLASSLDARHHEIIAEAALEQSHEEIFQARPALLSKQARATLFLIAANIGMFIVEIACGGATNGETLHHLGALFGPDVYTGQWWRIGAALFLHFGLPHIAMNMFALWVLGPFVEAAFGFVRFIAIYFIAGFGSMFMVLALSPHQFTVGASGAILGLVGATGALMLKGWLRERAHPAKRRLKTILIVLVAQTACDALIPQVSMTAHLSGALIGFVAAILIPNKLTALARGEH